MPVYWICLKHRAIERIELFRVELRIWLLIFLSRHNKL